MKDFLLAALLRVVIYIAPVAFGLVGAAVAYLGLGLYDADAGTITMSRETFAAGLTVMVGSGGTALAAVVGRWRTRKSDPIKPPS